MRLLGTQSMAGPKMFTACEKSEFWSDVWVSGETAKQPRAYLRKEGRRNRVGGWKSASTASVSDEKRDWWR